MLVACKREELVAVLSALLQEQGVVVSAWPRLAWKGVKEMQPSEGAAPGRAPSSAPHYFAVVAVVAVLPQLHSYLPSYTSNFCFPRHGGSL